MWPTRRLYPLALGAALLATSCGTSTSGLTWHYTFADAAQRSATAHLDAIIRHGGCTSMAIQYEQGFALGASDGMAPPVLDHGRWGFEVRAYDASCALVGVGCKDVDLPGPSSVTVPIVAMSAPAVCDASHCSAGVCQGVDAGPPPVLDGGPPPPTDGGPPPVDAGPCGGTCMLPNATSVCSGSGCMIQSCNAGYKDCDGNPANGCESACPTDPHTAPVCYHGQCVVGGCERGYSDCDGNVANGCETAGACMCAAGATCDFNCVDGCSVICDGHCTLHCGSCTTCDMTCDSGGQCDLACMTSSQNIYTIGGQTCPLAETCTL